MLPHDFPRWEAVAQQTYRWFRAGRFEAIVHDLRLLLRTLAGREGQPTAAILDSRTVQSTPESGGRAGDDGHKRRTGSKGHAAVDTPSLPLALVVTPADARDRAQVAALAAAVQEATGEHVELGYVDQGYAGAEPAEVAAAHGIRLEFVELPAAVGPKRGFVLLPRRWVVERDFARPPASAASPAMTSGWRPRWPPCTSSPSPASCSSNCSTPSRVHNRL